MKKSTIRKRRKADLIKYFRLLPYMFFGILALLFYQWSLKSQYNSILTDLSAASIFLILVYFLYEVFNSLVNKVEQIELTEFIQNKIQNDVFYILFSFKKYLHGYHFEEDNYKSITNIINYRYKEIEKCIENNSFLGFQIFKNHDTELFALQNLLDNPLIVSRVSNFKLILLIRIVNDIQKIESFFKNSESFKKDGKSFNYITHTGVHVQHRKETTILLKRTGDETRFEVIDSGFVNESVSSYLTNIYKIKKELVHGISSQIGELFLNINKWFNLSRIDLIPDNRFRKKGELYQINTGVETSFKKLIFTNENFYFPYEGEFDYSSIHNSSKRKLRIYCQSDSYPNWKIPIDIFVSSSYGEVGVTQSEIEYMEKIGWVEIIDETVVITKEGLKVGKEA